MRTGGIVLALAWCLATVAPAQTAPTRLRTPWGDPDLQGTWSNATLTPIERPDNETRESLTEAEAAEVNRTGMQRTLAPIKFEVDASGELNDAYMEIGQVVRSRRTSLVVDPPNGKIPYSPEGTKRRNLALARIVSMVPPNSWLDRSLAERCLMVGGLFIPNPFYLNNHMILQTRTHVAIRSEVMNETRIIPIDGRPQLDSRIEQWAGSSRGHWDGDTLVVESANYRDEGLLFGSTSELRMVERFTRVDDNTIDYQVTATDPKGFTRPWTFLNTLRAVPGPIYEYACHEGNYSLPNILAGARAQEAKAGGKAPAREPATSTPQPQQPSGSTP